MKQPPGPRKPIPIRVVCNNCGCDWTRRQERTGCACECHDPQRELKLPVKE